MTLTRPGRELPAAYRTRRGYRSLLDSIPIRISVSGTRGKTGLVRMCEATFRARGYVTYAKVTGRDPVSIKEGRDHPIPRGRLKGPILDENILELRKFWPMDVAIVENQAITPYTMRVFNRLFCRPQYVLLPNVRRDHLGDLARTLPLAAKAFARSVPPGCTLINGEADETLKFILEREAKAVGARFHDASPPEGEPRPPGYEVVTVCDAVLRLSTGRGLEKAESEAYRAGLLDRFRWQRSSIPGVWWFDAAKVNDVDSTMAVLRFLQGREPKRVTFVAYFREDRRDRTASFADLLAHEFAAGTVERAYLAGQGSRAVARKLRKFGSRVREFRDDVAEVPALLESVRKECIGGAVMTVANGVPPFPRGVAQGLATEHAELPREAGRASRPN